jgi:hypothetical protein
MNEKEIKAERERRRVQAERAAKFAEEEKKRIARARAADKRRRKAAYESLKAEFEGA